MGSKAFAILGLLLATVLLITSEVTARDLVETFTPKETTDQTNNGVEDAKYYGGGGCRGYGCGGGGGGCRGYGCGGGGGGCRGYGCGGGGGGCRGYGCGGGGGGCRGYGCGGGGGGGYCHFGCCRYGYGGCRRCCSYEGEPVDKED